MKKVCMVVLDGYGWSDNSLGNAVKMAPPRYFEELWNEYPHALLQASEEAVGLEAGQFGNSEVGHMTIGAGHKVRQSITLIHDFLKGNVLENENFKEMVDRYKATQKPIHLIGLLSDGKVHSSIDHVFKLLEIFKELQITNVLVHAISDGRDTDTLSLYRFLLLLEDKMKETGVGHLASISGRYYGMDRDRNWNRTQKYYDLLTRGIAVSAQNVPLMIQKCYEKGITDEFIPPLKTTFFEPIREEDTILWFNYRTDRAKQILNAFVNPEMEELQTVLEHVHVYTFLPIDPKIKTKNFLVRDVIHNPLGVYLSDLGLTQARIAETEKYAHVTYFFDGESNSSLEGCQKFLIPSPKVPTYDLKPEMSAVEITKKCIQCMEKDYDFIFMNYANPDMVGHTGNLEATIKACITVDLCLKVLREKAEENFYTLVILADHGNADQMLDEQGKPVTTHTTSLVPFIVTDHKIQLKKKGDLTNVAPTVLEYMEIARPKEMKDTESLIEGD